jgi:hypothetical protein
MSQICNSSSDTKAILPFERVAIDVTWSVVSSSIFVFPICLNMLSKLNLMSVIMFIVLLRVMLYVCFILGKENATY